MSAYIMDTEMDPPVPIFFFALNQNMAFQSCVNNIALFTATTLHVALDDKALLNIRVVKFCKALYSTLRTYSFLSGVSSETFTK
jgi:hypothetical protein